MKTIFTLTFATVALASSGIALAGNIPYQSAVSLHVGESTIVHGARGKCGKDAPDWEHAKERLPESELGTFSDGGVGTRGSRKCNGDTPARAVRFTASKAGTETLKLYGDKVKITVTTPEQTASDIGRIRYQKNLRLYKGDTVIVHGARGGCGNDAPEWDSVKERMPELKTGTLSDGGTGDRRSRKCGGETPARAVKFHATATGSDSFELFGDDIELEVIDNPNQEAPEQAAKTEASSATQ